MVFSGGEHLSVWGLLNSELAGCLTSLLRHVSRHACCSRSPGLCVGWFALVGACFGFALLIRGVVVGFFLT